MNGVYPSNNMFIGFCFLFLWVDFSSFKGMKIRLETCFLSIYLHVLFISTNMSIHSFHFISHSFLMRFKQLEKLSLCDCYRYRYHTVYRLPETHSFCHNGNKVAETLIKNRRLRNVKRK
jgi:hypothetical protein